MVSAGRIAAVRKALAGRPDRSTYVDTSTLGTEVHRDKWTRTYIGTDADGFLVSTLLSGPACGIRIAGVCLADITGADAHSAGGCDWCRGIPVAADVTPQQPRPEQLTDRTEPAQTYYPSAPEPLPTAAPPAPQPARPSAASRYTRVIDELPEDEFTELIRERRRI